MNICTIIRVMYRYLIFVIWYNLIIGNLMNQTARDAETTAQTCFSSCSSFEQISGHIETVATYANEINTQINRFKV